MNTVLKDIIGSSEATPVNKLQIILHSEKCAVNYSHAQFLVQAIVKILENEI